MKQLYFNYFIKHKETSNGKTVFWKTAYRREPHHPQERRDIRLRAHDTIQPGDQEDHDDLHQVDRQNPAT